MENKYQNWWKILYLIFFSSLRTNLVTIIFNTSVELWPSTQQQCAIAFLCIFIPLINHLLWSLFQGLNSALLVNMIRDFVTSSNLSSIMASLLSGVSYFISLWENSWNKENTGYKERLEGHYKLSDRITDETREASQLWTLSPWTGMDVGSQSLVILSGLYLRPTCRSWWGYVAKDAPLEVMIPNVLEPQTVW